MCYSLTVFSKFILIILKIFLLSQRNLVRKLLNNKCTSSTIALGIAIHMLERCMFLFEQDYYKYKRYYKIHRNDLSSNKLRYSKNYSNFIQKKIYYRAVTFFWKKKLSKPFTSLLDITIEYQINYINYPTDLIN